MIKNFYQQFLLYLKKKIIIIIIIIIVVVAVVVVIIVIVSIIKCSIVSIIPSYPVFRRGGGGYDSFTCRIICSNTRFCIFSDWSRNNTDSLLASDQLSYFNETSGRKLISENRMVQTKRVFARTSFLLCSLKPRRTSILIL